MEFSRSRTGCTYNLTIKRFQGDENKDEVFNWRFQLDASGLAALVRSVDSATSEAKMARSIGLKRKRTKNE